jgi:hypothetical protein
MRILLTALLVLLALPAAAQTLPPFTTNSTIAWDAGNDVTTVADAQAGVYKAYVTPSGGATVSAPLVHTCTAATTAGLVASCTAKVPTALVTPLNARAASLTVSVTGPVPNPDGTTSQVESAQSLPFVVGRPYGAPGRPRLTP